MKKKRRLWALVFAAAFSCIGQAAAATTPEKNGIVVAYANEIHLVNPVLERHVQMSYAEILIANASRFRVDPSLVMAIVTVESHWNTAALSWSGALGLGQLMPETARAIGVSPYSAASNLHGTVSYLHRLSLFFPRASGSRKLQETIAGYNAGPAAVKAYGGVPPNRETKDYALHVVRQHLRAWYHGVKHPGTDAALAL
jgi:soluble lytic murein transglycosylase-like protein